MKKNSTRGYRTWVAMKHRCNCPTASNYALYGGRGIVVCERWAAFDNFLADMGEPPDGYSLDRIDNEGPYTKENCRWATKLEQQNNKRDSRFLELHGRKQTVAQWAREIGIPSPRLVNRLHRGWSVEDTLTLPLRATVGGRIRRKPERAA